MPTRPAPKTLVLGAAAVVALAAVVYSVLPADARDRGPRFRATSVATSAAAPVPSAIPSASAPASPSAAPSSAVPSSAGPTASSSAPAVTEPFKGVANSKCADLDRLTTSWFYNWGTSPSGCTGHGFVPMISGKKEKTAAKVTAAITQLGSAGYDTVLGFNEPNKSDQANLTVDEAVALWPALTSDKSIAVGSPATSADSAGQAWLKSFMERAEAGKLRVDFVTVHWYGWNAGSCDPAAAEFERYLNTVQGLAGGRPLWITEFGCLNSSNPNEATVRAFYAGAVKMLARHTQVARYAWYPWTANNHLVADDGTRTALGKTFAQQPARRQQGLR